MKDEVGIAGSKSTQTRFVRDNRINYTSLNLLYLIITHLLMSTYLSNEVCGRHSGCSLVVTMVPWDDQFDSIACIITGYFCTPQKASVGMYSRCDYPLQILFEYFLILPSLLHPSIFNPRRMREGYGSRSVCLSVCYHASCYIPRLRVQFSVL